MELSLQMYHLAFQVVLPEQLLEMVFLTLETLLKQFLRPVQGGMAFLQLELKIFELAWLRQFGALGVGLDTVRFGQ